MKRFIFCLLALTFAACEFDFSVGGNTNATLSNITIECIDETTISNNTSANQPFTRHTYLCSGNIVGYSGECNIRVMHDNFILVDRLDLIAAGDTLPFQLKFAPEWEYLDRLYNTFTVILRDDHDNEICKTTVVVTKHTEAQL
ncbi:MAG: hypothetical protein IKV06_00200 [Alistipes sp.]|nr:hypothetical protein [Alistipes sp.]